MRWIVKRVAAVAVVLLLLYMAPLVAEASANPGYDDQLRGQLILMLTGLLAAFGAAWLVARYCRASN